MPVADDPTAGGATPTLGTLLTWHMDRGTRPHGRGDKWTQKELGLVCGVGERTIHNWRNNKHLPAGTEVLEGALFGTSARYDLWRVGLKDAYARTIGHADLPPGTATIPLQSTDAVGPAEDVRARVGELMGRSFFGREAEFGRLDAFLESQSRGVIGVAADAGGGKSAMLAHWIERQQSAGALVVRHFVSGQFKWTTTNPVNALRHLIAQIRRLRPDVGGFGQVIPNKEAELFDELTTHLASPPPDGKRLVVVLDGLDELDISLSDVFVRSTLADGNFVVVSARAGPAERPVYLQEWLGSAKRIEKLPSLRIDLPGLSIEDVLAWLARTVDGLSAESAKSIARALHDITDGLPLFLQYLIEDLDAGALRERTAEGISAALPAPFSNYVGAQLSLLERDAGTAWMEPVRKLFALLTITLGPIASEEIESFFAWHRRIDAAFPACPQLMSLDHRVARWFSMQEVDGKRLFSFAHPRLADAFRHAIGDDAKRAEAELIVWMRAAWPAQDPEQGAIGPSPEYALEWLARHLLALGDAARAEAGRLLASPQFLGRRLLNERFARRRLVDALDTWHGLDDALRSKLPGSRAWTEFWAENETLVLRATIVSAASNLDTAEPAMQCLGDTATSGSSTAPQPRAARPYAAPTTRLVRSIDDAHQRSVVGVLTVGERLVSWDNGGGMRFWSLTGDRLAGGEDQAHSDRIHGMLIAGSRLVSWGYDGAIRFWSLTGEPLPGGATAAHTGWVNGVAVIGGRLVSWGYEGDIHFWSPAGELLTGGGTRHRVSVRGVVNAGDRIVSWCEGGSIRFWSMAGQPVEGGGGFAHYGSVNGVLSLGDQLVSWGGDQTVVFWSLTGDRLPVGDEATAEFHEGERLWPRVTAHTRSVTGMLRDGERLVSWGAEGSVQFWSVAGTHLDGFQAHDGPVLGAMIVSDRLVSWSYGGAIRFWSMAGERLAGGDDGAHPIGGMEVVALQEHLVSWSHDGDIKVWTLAGELIEIYGGAHAGPIRGVMAVGRRLVSWGGDGAIRFWSLPLPQAGPAQKERPAGLAMRILAAGRDLLARARHDAKPPAPSTHVATKGQSSLPDGLVGGLLTTGTRLVSWGYDGALRFWSLGGDRMQGGAEDAHAGGVAGVLLIGERLVSWGNKGSIRFWSLLGKPLRGGDERAHLSPVGDVMLVGERLVSWGNDGAIRFWSTDGRQLPGGDLSDVRTGLAWVNGVLWTGDRLISWKDHGQFRLWTLDGTPLPGGNSEDVGLSGGVWRIDQRLVTWPWNSSMQFWSLDGERLPGGDASDHPGVVRGVLQVGDRLVSWCADGAIRFWTLSGERASGGSDKAHTRDGRHGYVTRVAIVDDRLVSWGDNGALRFWSLHGEELPGGGEDAYGDRDTGVHLDGSNLMTWTPNGIVRIWSASGTCNRVIAVPGGVSSVHLLEDCVVAFGRNLWVYKLART